MGLFKPALLEEAFALLKVKIALGNDGVKTDGAVEVETMFGTRKISFKFIKSSTINCAIITFIYSNETILMPMGQGKAVAAPCIADLDITWDFIT